MPLELSDAEERILEKADEQARKRLRLKSETELTWVRFGKPPALWKSIQPGDWLLCRTIENGQPAYVEPPQQVLGFDTVKSARGKVYHRVLFETLSSSEEMPWSRFQRRVASAVPRLAVSRPRGGPVVDDDAADVILGFGPLMGSWSDPGGGGGSDAPTNPGRTALVNAMLSADCVPCCLLASRGAGGITAGRVRRRDSETFSDPVRPGRPEPRPRESHCASR